MVELRLVLKPFIKGLGMMAGLVISLAPGFASAQSEWLTWGYDVGRTGWNQSETKLNKENASQLQLKWRTQLPTPPNDIVVSTLTSPIVATVDGRTRVFIVGSDNTISAIDGETGKINWSKKFPNTLGPKTPAIVQCPNTQNATPVIDKDAGIIYVLTSDGKLRGLGLGSGQEHMPAVDFSTPFARNWSLNLIDGVIYSTEGRGCGEVDADFLALDLKDPSKHVLHYFTGSGRPGGAWGRGGLVRGPKGMYAQTADGPYDPAGGKFGQTVIAVGLKNFRLVDSFTPANWDYLNAKDLDLASASPVIFPFQKLTLVAAAGKESVIYLLDAKNLGGADHHTSLYQSPRFGNDQANFVDQGIWGSMASWQDTEGKRWLLAPMAGPASKDVPPFKFSHGDTPSGSVMAFEVSVDPAKNTPTLVPTWISQDMVSPDPPVIANGVVYALQTGKNTTDSRKDGKVGSVPATNAILYALDGQTGQVLYSSEKLIDSWAHFSEPVVAGGNVYVSTWDGRVYAFGLKK